MTDTAKKICVVDLTYLEQQPNEYNHHQPLPQLFGKLYRYTKISYSSPQHKGLLQATQTLQGYIPFLQCCHVSPVTKEGKRQVREMMPTQVTLHTPFYIPIWGP